MDINCCIDNKISNICRDDYNFFFSKANVRGVGCGYKVRRGFLTSQRCIIVFVTRKLPINKVCYIDLIPKIYKGIITDVVETGIISIQNPRFHNNVNTPLKKRIRPVLGGYSIGVAIEDIGGSMGCLVTDNHDNYILSCNHVLADNNHISIGTFVLQPSLYDGGKSPKDIVGFLSEYVPISFTTGNFVDCAVAKVINKNNVSPKIALTGGPKGIREAKYGLKIKKVGETTGITEGTVKGVRTTYRMKIEGKDVIFRNQIMMNCIVDAGDSGAILLSYDNYAVGLCMASSDSKGYAMANTISDVLKSLNMLLVTD